MLYEPVRQTMVNLPIILRQLHKANPLIGFKFNEGHFKIFWSGTSNSNRKQHFFILKVHNKSHSVLNTYFKWHFQPRATHVLDRL